MTGNMPEILLYSPQDTPRVAYFARIAFGVFRSLPYRIVHSTETFLAYPGPKINYSTSSLAGREKEVFLPASGLLFETGTGAKKPGPVKGLPFPAFFPADFPGADFPFDLPAIVFYWLSRYEEYQPFRADRFGRFPASESLAKSHGVLHLPLVDVWLNRLYEALGSKWRIPAIPAPNYRFLPTYDVDIAWAYLHRPWWRQFLSIAKAAGSKNIVSLRSRLKVWSGHQDPYDQYSRLHNLHQQYGCEPLYFFLLGNYARHDRNISHRSQALQTLIKGHAPYAGLHPSMASNFKEGRLKLEKSRLEAIIGIPAFNTRQHYLYLAFPETYRRLESAGFKMDFSMGFADALGFRAGTGTPFPWYDLAAEQESKLWIQPFQVMDVTLREYLHLDPAGALDAVLPILRECRIAGTTFCTLWHNSSFSEEEGWKEWPEMYNCLLEEANNFFSLHKKA